MKKIAFILAFIITSCSFVSCGEKSTEESAETSASASESAETAQTAETQAETETQADTQIAETTERNTVDDGYTDDVIPDSFSRGKINGNVYTTDFGRIKLTLPEGWSFLPESEIFSMMNFTPDNPDDDYSVTQQLLYSPSILDAYAVNTQTGEIIVISYANLMSCDAEYQNMSAEEYADTVQNPTGRENVKLWGKDFIKVNTTSNYDGGLTTDNIEYIRKINNFIMNITFTSAPGGGDVTCFENCFEALR